MTARCQLAAIATHLAKESREKDITKRFLISSVGQNAVDTNSQLEDILIELASVASSDAFSHLMPNAAVFFTAVI